ncbi:MULTISPECIES: hypothetical protein [Sphingomonas]|jgi:hypothetical protein|uniref:Phasin domain-containing protein n=1 Tax=Sphingomonas turrisvirgatae TaxID=1888892 RepID=A0A1E3LYM8_9SPHN|nr:hypothetical protein [Sphingomonas turrisvirgatae]ODP38907.1 hypothetical protein BFL28_12655 [Sphingomonas turrisvirgatae]
MLATCHVMGSRSQTIDTAMRNPLQGDYRELGKMVPEKVAAFGKAGSVMANDWTAIHGEMLDQGRDLMSALFSWPPNAARMARIADRGSRLALEMSLAGGRAMAPVHAAVTANDRRLRRRH